MRTVWILTMIMFCVSHVRISLHFIKHVSDLPGWKRRADWSYTQGRALVPGSLCSHSVLWFPVPDIWQHHGIIISSFIVFLLKTMQSPFKKCLWSGMSLWGCKPLFIYRVRGLFFLSIVAFRHFVEMAEDLHDCGHFFFHNYTGHQAEPLGMHWACQDRHLISFHEVSYRWRDFRFSPLC